jgi:hypothetical protein
MAFRTNKVPAIEERTVSGSSVSFHSNFALPLKACKVSFEATQSGSGDPSPSNPRAISGVSSLNLSANSTPVSVSLGEERFGGELDVLTGVLTVTWEKIVFDGSFNPTHVNWRPQANTTGALYNSPISDIKIPATIATATNAISDKLKSVSYDVLFSNDIPSLAIVQSSGTPRICLRINDTSLTTVELLNAYLQNNPITIICELNMPITIQLSANELSSIIGNNTFSTDTGTLEITFSDLQEKTASGSVASFNTSLAMPLVSCNIAVNAWQEGSGDPSPSNVRPIHGFSEVNVTANEVVHTIQLGQEVYGAEVDAVNGVAHCTHIKKELTNLNWASYGTSRYFAPLSPRTNGSNAKSICSNYKPDPTNSEAFNMQDLSFDIKPTYTVFKNSSCASVEDFVATVQNQYLAYELAEPFDIQLTPTQIETLIGNNTIFADTGDIDLTYNDLDIAKRGSFREVFKLPS